MGSVGVVILIVLAIMILLVVAAFVIGFVQKLGRRNDALTKKSKLLEMYAAEEKAKEEALAAKREKDAEK